MNQDLLISGFSDEISSDLNTQLKVVSNLGMKYISLRGIDGKNIGDFTVDEIKENVEPRSYSNTLREKLAGRALVATEFISTDQRLMPPGEARGTRGGFAFPS